MTTLFLILSLFVLTSIDVPSGYRDAWERVPERHRALVREIRLARETAGRVHYPTSTITLPTKTRPGALFHEIGHLVFKHDPDLAADWVRTFWPGGTVQGRTNGRYAETSPPEDQAESYEEVMEHGCLASPSRDAFLRTRVFRPGELGACRP